MTISSLESKIKGLADEPGVYLMKDAAGEILYVGKAKSLRSRVAQYLPATSRGSTPSKTQRLSPRIELMLTKVADVEVVLTDNEVEALVLEFNLIKKYRPRFNVSLKDDKSYPYVRLDLNHPFPKLEYVRRVKKDGARYFGPYVSAFQIKDVLRWASQAFKLRDCSDAEFRNRTRPCILYQMGQCSAPCVKFIEEPAYHRNIEQVLKILQGKYDEVVRELTEQMEKASADEKFELAAELRDRIRHIEAVNEQQKITDPESEADRDVVGFARKSKFAVVVVMAVREGRTVGVFQYPFQEVDPDLSDADFVFQFLSQYYLTRHEEAPALLPDGVLLPEVMQEAKDQVSVLSRALGKRRDFRVPRRGEAADLMAMVEKTADYHLTELTAKTLHVLDDVEDVRRRLDLPRFPHRIECYDISHFQGEGTVASRVVFIDGVADKKHYRHYHVNEVEGPDDFKSLREVLGRRFTSDATVPDLVVVDGGKGQLAQAEAIFTELDVIGVPLAAIAKARTEGSFQDAEVTASMERIFKPGRKNPIMLKPGTGAYRVLTQARDEAHRFAITFHRKTRDKRRVR